ncbi:MAG: porphobilinogen synthase, partial [Rickettsiales bacterium]
LAQHRLSAADLVLPIFIQDGENIKTPIASLPDIERVTIDILLDKAKEAYDNGIRAIALFPLIDPTLKSPLGDEALFEKNLVCRAIRSLKKTIPDLGVIADVALDPYTTHGQDGIVEDSEILNDETVEKLCKQALVMAKSGCDVVAPSDMMDGRVGAIRHTLEDNGFVNTMILSYSAKYASNMYAPFRDAVGSKTQLGSADKRSYQMDFANGDEAMREIAMDIAEGADMVMVKPGITYLDIIARAASTFPVPVFAYQVSGEYAMIKAAAQNDWIDGDAVMLEHLIAFKRAGARAIFTYAALEIAKKL